MDMGIAVAKFTKWTVGMAACTLVALTGCAADGEDLAVDPTDDSAKEAYATAGSLTCPSASQAKAAQAAATALVKYIVGGANPFTKKPGQPGYGECFGVKTNVDNIRNFANSGMCTLQAPADGSTVCGLEASKYQLKCGGSAAWDYMNAAIGYMDACFVPGTAYFFFPGSQDNTTMYMDPEPARLTQSLAGSTGATAAAVYVNTAASTTAVKGPSTYTSGGTNPPAAGSPCSTGDLPVNTETTHMIQASGSYRKCL
jgi:hypothetical protein